MFTPVALRCLTYGLALSPLAASYAQSLAAHPSVQQWIAAARQEPESIPHEEVGEPVSDG